MGTTKRKNTITIKKSMTYAIVAFVFLMNNCFYLVNTDTIHITGAFAYSDIWLIVFVLFLGWEFVKYSRVRGKTSYREKYLIIALCLLTFTSAYQQKRLTGQSFSLGIRPQRGYLVVLLSYFPLRRLLSLKKLKSQELLEALMKIGTFAAAIYILQKLLYPRAQFIYAMMNYRNGSLRMYLDTSLVQLAGLIALYYFCKRSELKYLVLYIVDFIDIFWVGQGRLEIVSFLASSAIGVALVKKMNTKRLIVIVIAIIAVFVFFNTQFASSFWNAVLSAKTASTDQGNSMAIRYLGRERYFKQLGESVSTRLFGCGYPNSLYEPAASKAGYYLNINLNDNGMFGFTYIYGIIGLAVIVVLFVKMFAQAVKAFARSNNNLFIMYLSMLILMAYNVIMWYWYASGTFILVIVMSILEEMTQSTLNISYADGVNMLQTKGH